MSEQKKSKRKITKLLLRILLGVVVFVVLIPFLIAGLVLIPPVQQFLLTKSVDVVASYLDTHVELDHIRYRPYKHLTFEGFTVFDQQADTLASIDKLSVNILGLNTDQQQVSIGSIYLKGGTFYLKKREGDSDLNIQFLIDAFASDDTATSSSLSLVTEEILLHNLRFRFDDFNAPHREVGEVDFKHLDVYGISGKINQLKIEDDISAEIQGLHFKEQSGLILRCFDAEVQVQDTSIEANYMGLVTNRSIITGAYAMHFKDFEAFSDFENSVELYANLVDSKVNFNDIGYFSKKVDKILAPVSVSAVVKGPLSKMSADVRNLAFGESASLRSKQIIIEHATNPDELEVFTEAVSIQVAAVDLERLALPRGEERFHLDLPSEVEDLGIVELEGQYRGGVDEFYYYGAISSPYGVINTKCSLDLSNEVESYSGWLSSSSLDGGKLANTNSVGNAGFRVEFEGKHFDLDSLQLHFEGKIKKAELNEYVYQTIELDGDFEKRKLRSNVKVADRSARLKGKVAVDLRQDVPVYEFDGKLKKLDLAKTGLVGDSAGVLSAEIQTKIKGSSPANLEGFVNVTEFSYIESDRSLTADSVSIVQSREENEYRIELESPYASALIQGNTPITSLPVLITDVLSAYAPSTFEASNEQTEFDRHIDFTAEVSNKATITKFLYPDLSIDRPLSLSGSISSKSETVVLSVDTFNWALGEVRFRDQSIQLNSENGELNGLIEIGEAELSESYFLENVKIQPRLTSDTLDVHFGWFNESSRADSGAIALQAYSTEEFPINIKLDELLARVAGVEWRSAENASLSYADERLVVRHLDVRSPRGYVLCNGEINPDNTKDFKFELSNIDLAYIKNYGMTKSPLEGVINAKAEVKSEGGVTVAEIDMIIDSLVVDSFQVGHVEAITTYNTEQKGVDIDAILDYRGTRNVSVSGMYFPNKEVDQLDLKLGFNDFRARIIEPFIRNYADEIEGKINGEVSVSGRLDAPILQGGLQLEGMQGNVAFLNTSYRIPQSEILIEPDFIGIDYAEVIDDNGDIGHMNFTLFHNNFRDITYDLFFDVENYLVLNTTPAESEAYYGQANITGDISISGYEGSTEIVVNAETEDGTKLSIPLENTGESGEADFIRFVPPKGVVLEDEIDQSLSKELQGLKLDFQLTVNDNADVQIIFDEKIGDIIKVTGAGDILLKIDNKGNFNIYGDYTMNGGEYLFTLQNVINKRFSVEPGSRITWAGSPTDATVDLAAVYSLKAAPIDLTRSVGDTSDVYKKRLQTDVFLYMNGPLTEPDITFDVNIPSLPETDIANQLLNPETTSEQDMNQQVFALLLANRFFSPSSGVNAFSAGQATTYEVMSNQFSNWVSQYFENFDVGVSYRPEQDGVAQQTEVEISTELFNNRVLVEVNGTVQSEDQSTAEQSNNVAGEFNIEYKINNEGSLRAKAFNKANNYNPTNLNQSPYTQGLGIFYRVEFGTWSELKRKVFGRKKKKKEKE